MTVGRRSFLFAIPLSLLVVGSSQAAPKGSWDGTWRGAWGGQNPTSITIVKKKVVSYEYQGVSTPVVKSRVMVSKVVYEDKGTIVTLTRTGAKTANATLHSQQGDATAKMTKD
jgi:hypothetical protein